MFKTIWMWILNNVFRISTETSQKEIEDNTKYATDFQSINDINFSAIFSNKLSNYVVNDSNITIQGENVRTKLLDLTAQSMWKKMKKITSMAFGYGGVALVPYVKGGKLFYNLVPQSRIIINKIEGDDIVNATILAEKKVITSSIGSSKTYYRWTNYEINNNNLTIKQEFSDESGKKIDTPDFWENLTLELTITNVDKVLFGFIKSPINNRKTDDKYGVPITYGCDKTIREIKDTMFQIAREFELKQSFVGVDSTMFNGNNALPLNGLYKKIDSTGDDFWEVFDPAFRDSSYMNRLQELYVRLEHEIGTSAGIISQVQTTNATATEVKRAMYDTFTLVDDMRTNIEKGINDFFYACNILANTYNLSAMGEYEVSYEWDYSLVEDAQQTFSQMVQGVNLGITAKEELRQWMNPDESLEDSKKKIEEIRASEPSIDDLLGKE